jgi:putative transposase
MHCWSVPVAEDWEAWVNEGQTEAEVAAVRCSVVGGRPYGLEAWVQTVVEQLGLQATVRRQGWPRKQGTPEASEAPRFRG